MGIPCLLHTRSPHTMKLVGISALIGLASAAPLEESTPHHATVLSDSPYWVYHADYVSMDYYGELWKNTITLEEVPEAGTNSWSICKGTVDTGGEGFCPRSAEQAMRVYSDLVVRHFMPNSLATGVLDESEVSNIPSGMMTGYRTKDWEGNDWDGTVPDTIDNVDAVAGYGQGGVNDVYDCGPTNSGGNSWLQNIHAPTIEYVDAEAVAPNHCLEIGSHGGYGDTFADFKLKNVDCAKTAFVMCANAFNPSGGASHGGYAFAKFELNSTHVDIMKAAFDIMNDPANQVVEEVVDNSGSSNSNSTSTGGDSTDAAEGGSNMMLIGGIVVVIVAVALFFVLGKKE